MLNNGNKNQDDTLQTSQNFDNSSEDDLNTITVVPNSTSGNNPNNLDNTSGNTSNFTISNMAAGIFGSVIGISYFQQSLSLIPTLNNYLPKPIALSTSLIAATSSGVINATLAAVEFRNIFQSIQQSISQGGYKGPIKALVLISGIAITTYLLGIPGEIGVQASAIFSAKNVFNASDFIANVIGLFGQIPVGILLAQSFISKVMNIIDIIHGELTHTPEAYLKNIKQYIDKEGKVLLHESEGSLELLVNKYNNIKTAYNNGQTIDFSELRYLYIKIFMTEFLSLSNAAALVGTLVINNLNIHLLNTLAESGDLHHSLGPYAEAFKNAIIPTVTSSISNFALFPQIMKDNIDKLSSNFFAIVSEQYHNERNRVRSKYGHPQQSRKAELAELATTSVLTGFSLGPTIGAAYQGNKESELYKLIPTVSVTNYGAAANFANTVIPKAAKKITNIAKKVPTLFCDWKEKDENRSLAVEV
ncbi:hypothetical protein L3V82_10695 [Thiotrichales bacterium 19S3-7]|nr:hypothetical protein [Thiotrichales bacterium 19S3-7]MCF6802625.1 hypothetical protein [Thiotrichales bacterium 19S3-11]